MSDITLELATTHQIFDELIKRHSTVIMAVNNRNGNFDFLSGGDLAVILGIAEFIKNITLEQMKSGTLDI